MGRRTEIREGIARNAYIWNSFLIEGSNNIEPFDKLTEEERKPYYVLAGQLMIYLDEEGVVIKVGRELLPLADLEPDVDACFGQEVCCEILPKYLPNAGRVKDKCYQEIMGLAYGLANTIAKIQQEHNTKAGYVAVEPLIGDK